MSPHQFRAWVHNVRDADILSSFHLPHTHTHIVTIGTAPTRRSLEAGRRTADSLCERAAACGGHASSPGCSGSCIQQLHTSKHTVRPHRNGGFWRSDIGGRNIASSIQDRQTAAWSSAGLQAHQSSVRGTGVPGCATSSVGGPSQIKACSDHFRDCPCLG